MVKNKDQMQKQIEETVNHPVLPIKSAKLNVLPEFDLKLVSKNILNVDEKEVIENVSKDMDKTYQFFQIKENGKLIAQLISKQDADKIVEDIKNERDFKELEVCKIETKEYAQTDFISSKKVALEHVEKVQKARKAKAEEERKKAEKARKEREEKEAQRLASRGGEIRGSISPRARQRLNSLSMRNPLSHKRFGAHYGGYPGHRGTDLMTSIGTPVRASESGVIIKAQNGKTGYGRYIIVDHGNGVHTLYAHCSNVNLLSVGTRVQKGQTIAISGNTGRTTAPHVHFEIRLNGVKINPEPYI